MKLYFYYLYCVVKSKCHHSLDHNRSMKYQKYLRIHFLSFGSSIALITDIAILTQSFLFKGFPTFSD